MRVEYFRILMVRKNTVVPNKIRASIQTTRRPPPLIITFFTMLKYHLAGTILEMIRNGTGIFSIGNMNPLSISVGKNIPMSEINIAVC